MGGKSSEFCTVFEYRITRNNKVDRRFLGSIQLLRGEPISIQADSYVCDVCSKQQLGESSVVVVTRELYGINEAAYVCKDGVVTLSEGSSGCFRVDELISELRMEMLSAKKKSRKGLLLRLLKRA